MTVPVYGNALCVHDPDPRALDRIERGLAPAWRVSRPMHGWLLATAAINDAFAPRTEPWPPGGTVAFAEDSLGRCDADALTARPVRPDGDVTAIAVHRDGVTAVRSCAGLVPLYVARQGSRVAISTLMAPLVRHVLSSVRIDGLGLSPWALGWGCFPDGRSWIQDVWGIAPGHQVELRSDGSWTTSAYWDPRPQRSAPRVDHPRPEHAQKLRAGVLAALDRMLDRDGRNLLTLSGGVDSSLLAYLIAARFRTGLSTVSLRSTIAEEAALEDRIIGEFASLHPPVRRWTLDGSVENRLALVAKAGPVISPTMHPALHLLPSLAAETPLRVYVGGEFADHVGGGSTHHADWLEQMSLTGLALDTVRRRLPTGRNDVLRWMRRRLLGARPPATPAPAWFLSAEIREAYSEWAARRDRRLARDAGPWRHLAARMELDAGATNMNWETCSALGIVRAMPFRTRETLEAVFACHPSEMIGPEPKRLVKAAFPGDAPAEAMNRRKFVPPQPAGSYQVPVSGELRLLLDPAAEGPFAAGDALIVGALDNLAQGLASTNQVKAV